MGHNYLSLFEGFGIEAEYMVVSRNSLNWAHGVEEIMRDFNGGEITDYAELGEIAISNELVDHVLEFKGKSPLTQIAEGDLLFHRAITQVMKKISARGQTLLGTSMHPWMNPEQMQLWPHGQKEIYQAYDRIFGCKGHGWSNLQSVHLNLPFADEAQFIQLHNAVRVVMPLIPYLAASGPIVEGKWGEWPDNRLKFYEKNQGKVPSIAGRVIPPAHQSFASYHQMLEGMYRDMQVHDPEGTLRGPWLNSHGAIAKFDVQAVEIRIMDIQECPLMDFAILNFLEHMLRRMVQGKWASATEQASVDTELLRLTYDRANSWQQELAPREYAQLFFPRHRASMSMQALLVGLFEEVRSAMPKRYSNALSFLLTKGNLSRRLRSQLPQVLTSELLHGVYQELTHCLRDNRPYAWS